MAAKKKAERFAILCNATYGIYCGIVGKITPSADGTMRVEVAQCRHIPRWFGKTGGITSLAAHGLCGPRAAESRVGAPCDGELSGIRNIFDCTAEARATLEAAKQQ